MCLPSSVVRAFFNDCIELSTSFEALDGMMDNHHHECQIAMNNAVLSPYFRSVWIILLSYMSALSNVASFLRHRRGSRQPTSCNSPNHNIVERDIVSWPSLLYEVGVIISFILRWENGGRPFLPWYMRKSPKHCTPLPRK